MILLVLGWVDWPAVFVIIGVSATFAQVWLLNEREKRSEAQIGKRLRKLEEQAEGAKIMIDRLNSRKVDGS